MRVQTFASQAIKRAGLDGLLGLADDDQQLTNMSVVTMLLEENRRMLAEQCAALESLRGRAITMLSVGTVIAALFGSQLPSRRSSIADYAIPVALLAFALTVLLVARVIRPRALKYDHSLLDQLGVVESGPGVRAYDLAFRWVMGYEADRADNEKKIRQLMWTFVVVCWLVGIQAIAWAIAVL